MDIYEIVFGVLILVVGVALTVAGYYVKNEKGGVNAAFDGASEYMSKRRDDRNLKLNRFVAAGGTVLAVSLVVLTICNTHLQ